MHGRNCLKFDMHMYPDCNFNCLHFGHGLLIFLILTVFWLSETSQICSFWVFSWECIGGIGWTNLVISEKNGKDNFQHIEIIQSPSGGYPWLLCSQTFDSGEVWIMLKTSESYCWWLPDCPGSLEGEQASWSPVMGKHSIGWYFCYCCWFVKYRVAWWCHMAWLNKVNMGLDNGLLPVHCPVIIWFSDDLLSIRTTGTNFNEIIIKTKNFSLKNTFECVIWNMSTIMALFQRGELYTGDCSQVTLWYRWQGKYWTTAWGPYQPLRLQSLSDNTAYHRASKLLCLIAEKLSVESFLWLWNLTNMSAALLLRC